MSNIKCNIVSCDNNTGFTNECMYGITDDLIKTAKDPKKKMCRFLRMSVLEFIDKDTEVIL